MPRLKNEMKYTCARSLLKSGWSIRKVQEELKRIFGSGISPNSLSSMGKEFQHVVDQENTIDHSLNKYYALDTSGTELSSVNLSQIATQFTSTTNKFSEQMEAQNILIKDLITNIKTNQGLLPPVSADSFLEGDIPDSYDITQPSEDQIEFQFSQWEHQLLEILTPRPQPITAIHERMGILRELVIRCLNHLLMANKIVSFEKDGIETYRRRKQEIKANLSQTSKEDENFKD